ncbi:hypothetical protein [uncultured Paludibaculum sp.]|uniref:DUF7948 domain-containing protein n=1 Tax=uncultured Paludibaculum sp. TaxID=1765020 RepID=UPI002AAB6D52|nr:hypothetical protein [uncultured Paludibaculum sp.]
MSRLLTILFLCAAARPMLATEKPFAFGTVRFEANRGQADSAVRYMARARGQQIFFTDTGVVFSPPSGPAIRMTFAGSGRPEWVADGPSSDSISYYVGSDPRKWVKGAPVYDRITWRGVYRGVDVTFYGDGDRLEYDLVLAPGADPSRVRLEFAAPARVSGNADGVLEISEGGTKIHQRVPAIYQETASGVRRKIAGDFQSAGQNAATLKVASYDTAKRLVVDPVIEMATYLGGENDDEIVAMTDGFVAGNTRSIAFPLAQRTLRGGRDVFVRGTGEFIPGQTSQTTFYGTFVFGGSGDDELAGIALQTTLRYVSLSGTTTSQDLAGAGTSKYHGGASDGFLTILTLSQGYLNVGSTQYIGGSGEDRITAFSGGDYIQGMVGVTDSADLPVVGDVPQKVIGGGKDAFYGIVSPVYGYRYYGYLGGSGDDAAYAVSVRSNTSVWIGGETSSGDFPFPVAGLDGPSDGFLAEIFAPVAWTGPQVVTVATYRVGGNGADSVRAIAAVPATVTVDPYGLRLLRPFTVTDIGIAGTTTSTDLPVRNAAFPQFAGESDGFAGMWNVTAAAPRWLTYLGGSGADEVTAATMDWAGDLYVGGWTRSTDLPVAHALQPASAGGEEGMFAVFDGTGVLHHLTYFGGSGDDRIRDVRLINSLVARVAGSTTSTDLPQRSPLQDRGEQAEGFWANIGTDYVIGPSELILAKDGVLPFSVRPGRTLFRNPVTYRSSDPSRVRLVYLGRSFDEVTAPPEDNIAIEALTDSGEATITITAPGFTTKEILVRLYPGVFIQAYSPVNPISTWASPSSLYAIYRALDPATGQLVGASSMSIRAGVAQPVFNWSVSDPSVFEIVNAGTSFQLRVLKAGDATLRLTVDGFTVLQEDRTITAATPRPLSSNLDLRLGRDLYVNLPLAFGLNGVTVNSAYRGTFTARSADPSRLLLSLASDRPGSESVTLTMSGFEPVIYAQALASEGTVQILLTSSEFEGEIPMTVTLEPAVIKWGSFRYGQPTGAEIVPAVSLTATVQATQLTFTLQGQSGSAASGYRPGAPPVTLSLTNSDPTIVELNRLTRTLGSTDAAYTVFGVAAGTSELRLTTSSDELRPANETVHVEVAAPTSAALLVNFPTTVYVGKGLQTGVGFRYLASQQTIDIVSDDSNAVVLSPSTLVLGSAHLSLAPKQTYSDEYTFQVQALKSDGETRVRLRFPTGEEREIRVVLLPSGAGFAGYVSSSASQGFDRSAPVRAWALDRQTGIGIFTQTPQPAFKIAARFRSEGAPVRLSPENATLTVDVPEAVLNYTLPPVGQDATLIVESDAEGAVSLITARMRVRNATATLASTTMLLARNELREFYIGSYTNLAALTATSSDPDRVLLSATASAPGSQSLDVPNSGSRIYIHALAESGNATVIFKSGGVTVLELQVALQPLVLTLYSGSGVTLGGSANYTLSLNAYMLRPDSGSYRFNVQSANPAVATVDPATFELGGADGTVRAVLRVTGVAQGATKLIFEGPPEIIANPVSVTVGGSAPQTIPTYAIGKNLQAAVRIDLGSSFSNPNGAIVKLTTSEPGRVLLSRSASTAGTASVSVAVPAGQNQTQLIYFQAIEEGDAVVQLTANDATRAAANIQVTRSWVSCGSQEPIVVGSNATRECSIRSAAAPSNYLQEISPRVGLEELNLRLESSAPDIFTVTPQSVSLQSGSGRVVLLGVSPGVGELRLTPPAGFGPSPDGSETMAVSVVEPRLSTNRSTEAILGKDTQVTYTIPVPAGVTVSASSQDASHLLVSADAKIAGAATATAASNGSNVDFTLQGLAGSGTAEVVFSAPGYQDLRVAVRLRPAEFYWTSLPYGGSPVSLHIGNSATLTLGMRSVDYQATPRAGANLAVDVRADRAGIVTLEPARVVFNGPDSRGEVKVQATAPGSVLLQIVVPDGFTASTTPALVAVVP